MWRSILWSSLGSLLATMAQAQQPCSANSLPVQKNWVCFDVVGGRLTALNGCQCKSQETARHNPLTGRSESFAVMARDGQTRIRYELVDPQCRLIADICEGSNVEIVRQPLAANGPVALRFFQPAQGEVSLVVGENGAEGSVRAACFWRLLLADPVLCQKHLMPVLALLRSHWRLHNDAGEIEQLLLDRAASEEPTLRPEWETLLTSLDDPSYQKRHAAHQRLLSAGPRVLPFLCEASSRRLSPEQRRRVAELIVRLETPQIDTAACVASRLLEDKAVWLTLMARSDFDTRELAARRLGLICQRPLEFDPKADDAVRSDQLARIRSRVARN